MCFKRLFAVSIVLLLPLFIYGCGGSGNSSSAGPGQNPLIVNSALSSLQIEADIPPMQVNQQVYIAVSIYPTGATGKVSAVPAIKNATAVVTSAAPIGTPRMTLVNAFGQNHLVNATATLETSQIIFSVTTATVTQTKPLDQPKVEWDWFVTPQVAGIQTLGVDIEAYWTSTLTGKQSSSYTLGFPKFQVDVQAPPVVPTPMPTPPPSDPLAIANAILPPTATLLAGILGLIGVIWTAKFATSKRKTQQQDRVKRRPHPKE